MATKQANIDYIVLWVEDQVEDLAVEVEVRHDEPTNFCFKFTRLSKHHASNRRVLGSTTATDYDDQTRDELSTCIPAI